MIAANFYHIKSSNGLFFYGLDYLREHLPLVRFVLTRPSMESQMRKALPGVNIVVCSAGRYLCELVLANRRGDLIYTPTSHPLPGINRQWIVLHDAYPFTVGPMSLFKRLLLRMSLSLSRCRVAYINRSEAKPFIVGLGVNEQRMIFAPNRFPDVSLRILGRTSLNGITAVGLLGTDSAKKNYDLLFAAVRSASLSSCLVFRVYGHDSAYFREIQGNFPDIQVELVRSDDTSIVEFLSGVDVIASAAEQEGFGRPLASALLSGLRVELLDRPVFREFFNGGARFHSDIDSLVQSLSRVNDDSMSNTSFTASVTTSKSSSRKRPSRSLHCQTYRFVS
jgi:hypothetical protein